MAWGYARFPFSDIDVTVVLAEPQDANVFAAFYQGLGQFLPWFSEVNIYVKEEWQHLEKWMNCCEKERSQGRGDELEHFGDQRKYERFVFIVKMICSNKTSVLKNRILGRKYRKWGFYLKVFSNSTVSVGPLTTFEDVLAFLAAELQKDFPKFNWEEVFECLIEKGTYEKYPWAEPIEWLKVSLRSNQEMPLASLGEDEKAFVRAAIRWEICGVYSQISQIGVRSNLLQHVKNLRFFLQGLGNSEDELIGLSRLATYIEKRFCSVESNM